MKRLLPYFVGTLIGMLVMVAFIAGRASASPLAATGCFPDTNGHWAETFICWLKDNGISSGYPDGTYKPENNVTRAEMSVMLNKLDTNLNQTINTTTDTKINTAVAQVNSSTDTKINDAKTLMRATGGTLAAEVNLNVGQSSNIVPITITAPVDGGLIITGTVRADCIPFPTLFCTGSYISSEINFNGTLYNIAYETIAQNSVGNTAHSLYLAVNAGTYPIDLKVTLVSGGGTTVITGASLTAQFIPYDGSGNPIVVP
ncbi:MAG TPA: S-layer homology domain-containing protein [Anaerolineales bacterium]|nr:S-layer homology domain-containing protein [Anaerolineales bacterium]HNC09571.1 S-layer homology domain-containing protein [Anaerolineales bacterium]